MLAGAMIAAPMGAMANDGAQKVASTTTGATPASMVITADPNYKKPCERYAEGQTVTPDIEAGCFSRDHPVVSVLVSGNAEGMSGSDIATYIVGEFDGAHTSAKQFLEFPEWDGVVISYYLNGLYYGPYNGNNWRHGMNEVLSHKDDAWAMQRQDMAMLDLER